MSRPWTKCPADLYDDPRLADAGPLALALHSAAWAYCGRNMTDGVIAASRAKLLIDLSDFGGPKPTIEALVSSGVWQVHEDGYLLVDFLEYNRSGEQIRAAKEAAGRGGKAKAAKSTASDTTSESLVPLQVNPRTTTSDTPARSRSRSRSRSRTKNQSLEPSAAEDSDPPPFELDGSKPDPKPKRSERKSKKATPDVDPLLAGKREFRHDWLRRAASETEGEDPERPESELRKRFRWGAAEEKLLDSLAKTFGLEELRTRFDRWWSRTHWVWAKSTGTPSFRQFAQHFAELVPLKGPSAGQGAPQIENEWYRSRRLPEPSKALLWIDLAIKSAIPGTPLEEQRQEVRQRLIDEAGDLDIGPAFRVAIEFLETLRNASEFDARKTIKPQIQSAYVATCRESVRESA